MISILIRTSTLLFLTLFLGVVGTGTFQEARAEGFLDKLQHQVEKLQQATQSMPVLDGMPGINWAGTYMCNGKDSAIRLNIQSQGDGVVQAIAYVYPTYAPNNATGSYELQGTYDQTSRELDLAPVKWIHPLPRGYVMVGFKGQLSTGGNTIEGKISYSTCGAIRLSHLAGMPVGVLRGASVVATTSTSAKAADNIDTPAASNTNGGHGGITPVGNRLLETSERDLKRFEVAGVRLGMSIEEAKTALSHFDPTLKFTDTFGSLERVQNSKFLGFTVAKSENKPDWTSRQEIRLDFSPPPHEGRVIALRRHVEYREGARPTIVDTIAALDRKYGIPSTHSENISGGTRLYAFTEDAMPITGNAVSCANQTPYSVDSTTDVFFNIMPSKICGLSLSIGMYSDHGGLHGSGTDQLLILLDETLVNAANIRDMRADTERYMNEKVRAQAASVATPAL